MYSKLKMKK